MTDKPKEGSDISYQKLFHDVCDKMTCIDKTIAKNAVAQIPASMSQLIKEAEELYEWLRKK